jgi:altronate dehydratase large subunit
MIQSTGKPTAFIRIEDMGTPTAISKGIEIALKMSQEAALLKREEFPVSELILGTECGGSDALSGVTANPTIGLLSDWVVENGGTSILTEITELIGCNDILKARAKNEQVAKDINRVIEDAMDVAKDVLGGNAARAIAPGNMDGGMTTIQEKALGCVRKGGSATVNEVVDYGVRASEKGLVIMDGPGYDVESIGGMAAMGAQVIIFSTGRGNVVGFPIIPVIKVASNSDMYNIMKDNMDFNAGKLLEDGYDFEDAKKDISELFCDVASGQQTKAELNKCGGLVCLWSWSKSL